MFSSMRLRCSSVREGAAGVEEAAEGVSGAAGAGVEWRSAGKPASINGSGSPKICVSGTASSSSRAKIITETWI